MSMAHQAWKVLSCFQQHSLFLKDLLVFESLQNIGIHWLSCKAAWAKACWKVITDFLYTIFCFLRWHKSLCHLDPALFFRLSRVLYSQDTDFTLSVSSTGYLQTVFLFPSGHMQTMRNGPFIRVLQTNRTMRYNQVEHSPVCPLLFSFDSIPYIWPLKTFLLEGLSFSNQKKKPLILGTKDTSKHSPRVPASAVHQGPKEKKNDLELSIQRPTAVKQRPLLFLMEQLTSFFTSFHESCLHVFLFP